MRSTKRTHRAAGDRARDRGDWPTAIDRYRTYLNEAPGDAAIWVQYGHALKESDLLAEAEAAYREAVVADPADTDARLHLAHLLKRQDRKEDAANLFLEIMRLAPNAEVVRELGHAGHSHEARMAFETRPAGVAAGGIFLELKDLFQYLSLHTTVTGITRVTLGLINYILHEMPAAESRRYHFVHHYGDGEGLLLVPREKMRTIVRGAMHDIPDISAMQALIQDIRSTSQVFRLTAGDTYLIVGAFWEFAANPSWMGGMRQRGVTIGAYIYDLIPITHAQYCVQGLTDAFTIAFAETARMLDFALTISAFVAEEVRSYMTAHGVDLFPIAPVPLAHVLRFEDRTVGRAVSAAPASAKREYLAGIPFVLCVCTIEARKNHVYLFNIWRRMLDAHMDVPDLVFVGRPGWRVEALMDRIEDANYLNGRLHILYGLSDEELADLYDRCLFTVFPSFVEGWGLPVGESLAHGKLCVASSASSIPEVGGDNVIYVDPFDQENGYAVISTLLGDPAELARRQAHLRATFRPRTWNDVGRDFFAAVGTMLAEVDRVAPDRRMFAPHLATARLLETARLGRLGSQGSAYVVNPERLVFAQGWRGVEATGTWMLDPEALLVIQTDCAPSTEVGLVLDLGTSPWVGAQNVLGISAGGGDMEAGASYRRPLKTDTNFWVKLKGRVGDKGLLSISLTLSGAVRTSDGHAPLTVRVRGIGYAPLDDSASRIELLERALLT